MGVAFEETLRKQSAGTIEPPDSDPIFQMYVRGSNGPVLSALWSRTRSVRGNALHRPLLARHVDPPAPRSDRNQGPADMPAEFLIRRP